MKCYNDITREAVGSCALCGKGVCSENAVYIENKLYCRECAIKKLSGHNFVSAKKLYRSTQDRFICGVCSGLAEYMEIDVTLVRVLWVVVTLFTGILPGVVVYFIMCFAAPIK